MDVRSIAATSMALAADRVATEAHFRVLGMAMEHAGEGVLELIDAMPAPAELSIPWLGQHLDLRA